jgi:hypothetical protein
MKKILVVEVFLTTKGKKKTQKNVVGRWNHKKNKAKWMCWGFKCPSPECNESPEVKKNLVLQGKKSDQRKLLFTLEKLVF